MEAIVGLAIGTLISAFVSGLILWIVSKFDLGLHVDSFGWAMLAGLLIGAVTNVARHLVPNTVGILGLFVNLIISAAVIFACGAVLKGLTVRGYTGALIAAVSIAVVGFLLLLVLLSGLGIMGFAAG